MKIQKFSQPRTLVTYNDFCLTAVSDYVTEEEILELKTKSGEFYNLVEDMKILLTQAGLGLAAAQLGVLKRVFIMHLDKAKEPLVMINPKLKEFNHNTVISYEGCLSLPGVFGYIERPYDCTMEFTTVDGNVMTSSFDGLESAVALHEYDHLDGTLFPSRGFTREQRRWLKKKYKMDVPKIDVRDYTLVD